ncbi:MAG: hypothetical protein K2P73_11060 [Lachnospiraceae bacterium]|nr:hypothetical protein [Lachnospiraceae bacterium]
MLLLDVRPVHCLAAKGIVITQKPIAFTLEDSQKGLHCSPDNGMLSKEVAGIQVEVEEPKDPDMILDNEGDVSVSALVGKVLKKYGI